MKKSCLLGISLVSEKTIVVGSANQELDHGKKFWLCIKTHGTKVVSSVNTKDEAINWLYEQADSEEVYECKLMRKRFET